MSASFSAATSRNHDAGYLGFWTRPGSGLCRRLFLVGVVVGVVVIAVKHVDDKHFGNMSTLRASSQLSSASLFLIKQLHSAVSKDTG